MSGQYANLCTAEIAHAQWLFVDDIQSTVKEIGTVNQIANKLKPTSPMQGHAGMAATCTSTRFKRPHRRGVAFTGQQNVYQLAMPNLHGIPTTR